MNSQEVANLLAQAANAGAQAFDDLAAAFRRLSHQSPQSIADSVKLGLLAPASRLDSKARRRQRIVNALNRVKP